MIRKIILLTASIFLVYIGLLILQIWVNIFEADIFFKISLTFGIIIGVGTLAVALLYHLRDEADHRDDKFIN